MEEGSRARSKAAGRARSGKLAHGAVKVTGYDSVQMGERLIQLLHHGGICAFLWAKHRCRAPRSAERVINVTHDFYGNPTEPLLRPGAVNGGNFRQRRAHGHKGLPPGVIELDPQRGSRPAAPVVGGTAAQTEYQMPGAVLHRMEKQLPHAVGGGTGGVQPVARHGQPRCSRHFHHCRVADSTVKRRSRLSPGPRGFYGHAGPAHSLQEAIHGPLPAVGHRQADHLAAREKCGNAIRRNLCNGPAVQGTLEGIGNHNYFFHRRASSDF